MGKKILGVDFGTATVKIYKKGNGIVLKEKNVVAIASKKKVFAVGDGAYEMLGKSPINIQVMKPIKNGVIADLGNMQLLLSHLLDKITGKGSLKKANYLVAVPTDITEVEKRAFYDLVARSAGNAKSVSVVEKPIATALGMDIDITKSQGVMTVDIGADTTEVAILSMGGIVASKMLSVGGRQLDVSIKNAIRKEYSLLIGDKTAEVVKIALASATEPDDQVLKVYGRDIVTGLPREVAVESSLVYYAIKEHLYTIINGIKLILERTPPEISSDIIDTGIYVTGGTAKIKNLADIISQDTGLHVNIAEQSESSVVKGLGVMIENRKLMSLAAVAK
ncbi:MAG: rod shape-determining protein [Lachnospiraceae bacterium]|nr:rod shape-determining protein [Lachnospiraceae bacterium]